MPQRAAGESQGGEQVLLVFPVKGTDERERVTKPIFLSNVKLNIYKAG